MSDSVIKQIPEQQALMSIRQMVPLRQGAVYLFQGESSILDEAMQEFIDRLGMQGQVQVVVGGNRISFEHLPQILGEQIGSIYEIMDRILVSRAESCYQMKDVLASLEMNLTPVVIIDMLDSFYEEDLTDQAVTLLLQNCIQHIHRLSELAPILISAVGDPQRPNLLKTIEKNSDERYYFQPPVEIRTVDQPSLGI